MLVAPDSDEVQYQYGRFLRLQKRDDEALPALQRAVELNANNMNAKDGLGNLYWDRKEYVKALPEYEALGEWLDVGAPRGTANDETKARVYFRHGYCLGEIGKSEAAVAAFEKSIEKNPKDAWVFNLHGFYSQKVGNLDQA